MLNKYLPSLIALNLMFVTLAGTSSNAQGKTVQLSNSTESQAAVHPDIVDQIEINQVNDGCFYIPGRGWRCL